MPERKDHKPDPSPPAPDTHRDAATGESVEKEARPREIGGRDGPDPTRYGDWEKNGQCIDF